MQNMYAQAMNYHIYTILVLVLSITLFYLYTQIERDFFRYQRRIRIWMPIYIFAIASVAFTGIVMMAAKRLDFNFANSMMIAASFGLIFLEVYRSRRLKQTTQEEGTAYRFFAKRIYAIELIIAFMTVYIAKLG